VEGVASAAGPSSSSASSGGTASGRIFQEPRLGEELVVCVITISTREFEVHLGA